MATAKPTKREEDDRLRKELEHADVEKFKKAIKKGFQNNLRPSKKEVRKAL